MKYASKTRTEIEFDFTEIEKKVLKDFEEKIDIICDELEDNRNSVVIGHYADYNYEDFLKFSYYLHDLLEK